MEPLRGERVVLRPLEAGDVPALRAAHSAPEVATWWGLPAEDFPFGDEPETTRLAIIVEGEVAGMIQFAEEADPDSRHAEIDIFLGPARQGRGLGTDAVTTLARHLLDEEGHHRLTLYPDVENAAAIRCYEKAGFRRVGVLEASARHPRTGEWRDELLMELVVRSDTPRPW
jgi:aminoglycoside 6'-N-acetyltransferase